jgi:hypothetical protein
MGGKPGDVGTQSLSAGFEMTESIGMVLPDRQANAAVPGCFNPSP